MVTFSPISFFIIQIESHINTIGIVHFRAASGSCPEKFEQLQTSGTPEKHDYSACLLFVPDGRFMEKCKVVDKKYINGKKELLSVFSDILLGK